MTKVDPNNAKTVFKGRTSQKSPAKTAKKLQAKALISERQMRRIGARS